MNNPAPSNIMAKEILAIPEEKIPEVIAVIRQGLKNPQLLRFTKNVSDETIGQLTKWCDDSE